MAERDRLTPEEAMNLHNETNRSYALLQDGEFEEVLKILENVIPILNTQFKRFEWSDPIDAYAYAKQVDAEVLAHILESKGLKKLDDLRGMTLPHPYFTGIQELYNAALTNKSAAHGKLEQWDTAIEVLKKALGVKRDNSETWTNLAILYIDSGNPQAGASHFRTAIRHKPQEERFWSNIGKYYELRNRGEELAIVERTMSLLGESDVDVMYNYLDLCLYGGDIETADQVAHQLLQSKPNDPEALLRLARMHIFQNNHDRAAKFLNQALKKDKKHAELHAELGRVLTIMGKHKDATKALEKSLKLDPQPPYKYLHEMIKKKIDTTSHINMISAMGERQYRIHMGMKIPLGMTLLELLYNITKMPIGALKSPYGFETTFVQIFEKEGETLKFAADHLPYPGPTAISGREVGELSVMYTESFSEVNYLESGYRPEDLLATIPLQYNTVHVTNADVSLGDNVMMPMLPTLVQFHDIKFAEKKKELLG
ncbi:MAG: tetratricopeptide repeat protein [Candidatus Thorarchaeota archaeon]